ncbi:transglycosylase SLT domain-containing protein [Serratia fonticola]|uniref:transglycosylase SLT domain-containing protein n=1 Tax=Serratia fonticola TaxID=47917 RepID=UPI00137894C8|nr:transglycosylase SLT domain-containing protein [Serratia fonticola]NCG53639.1 transglycosylase SLT domain-containing protein [Serratia fonticola]
MRRMRLAYLLFTLSLPVSADCFDMAGRDYKIDPDLLRAIAWNESKFNPVAVGQNSDGSLDIGLMQINTQHANKLSALGISQNHLSQDPCMNIYTGAYILATSFKKWGVSWAAVGAYNAGFKDTHKQDLRRYKYAKKIHDTYNAIKLNKSSITNNSLANN